MKEEDEELEQEDWFLPRPFVEESETPLIAIYEFSDSFTRTMLRDAASKINAELEGSDIVTGDIGLDNNRDGIILVSLQKTNISYQEIRDLRDIGMKYNGYEDLSISTVPSNQILRLQYR